MKNERKSSPEKLVLAGVVGPFEKWSFQLNDEPNLCMENGWKSRMYPLGKTNMAGWNIPIFNWKYIFHLGPIFIAMLVYRSVVKLDHLPRW